MAIDEQRIHEIQVVFNRFYDGFSKRHSGPSVTGTPKEVIAGWLVAASNMTVAYYTDAAGFNVAGEIRDTTGGGRLFNRDGVMR